jgi:hypothetical protein
VKTAKLAAKPASARNLENQSFIEIPARTDIPIDRLMP